MLKLSRNLFKIFRIPNQFTAVFTRLPFHSELSPIKNGTLMCLIEGQALIKWQGGIFSKFNKRAGSNKEAGWNIFSNLIRGQERFVPYKRAGWKFNK